MGLLVGLFDSLLQGIMNMFFILSLLFDNMFFIMKIHTHTGGHVDSTFNHLTLLIINPPILLPLQSARPVIKRLRMFLTLLRWQSL